jgi:hypothetical protein
MPPKKTACRRSARVAARATSAATNRTKASMSTTPDKMSKTGRLQARKSAKNGCSPKVPRQMPRHQEESEWEDWNRENVSSDEAVEDKANSVVSAQGRERQNALRGKDRTKGGDSLEYLPVPSRNARRHHNGENKEQPPDTPPAQTPENQPPPKGVWLQKTRLTTGGRPPLAGVTALLCMLTTDRQPPLLGVGPGSQPPLVGGRQPQSVSKESGLSCNRTPLLGLQFMSRATVTYSTNGPS